MKTPHTQSLPVPCTAWANRLAALHPNDLTPDEQTAVKNHLASCPACAAVYAAYQEVDARILSLPAVQPSLQQIARLEASIADQTQNNPHRKPPAVVQERPALPVRSNRARRVGARTGRAGRSWTTAGGLRAGRVLGWAGSEGFLREIFWSGRGPA